MMIQTVGAMFAAVKTLLQEERVTTHQSLMRKSEGCHQEDSIFIAIRKFLSSHRSHILENRLITLEMVVVTLHFVLVSRLKGMICFKQFHIFFSNS